MPVIIMRAINHSTLRWQLCCEVDPIDCKRLQLERPRLQIKLARIFIDSKWLPLNSTLYSPARREFSLILPSCASAAGVATSSKAKVSPLCSGA